MKKEKVRLNSIISGKVQGVGFRYFVLQIAQNYRLVGFVRNLSAGEVELVAQGDKIFIEDFIQDLKRGNGKSQIDFMTQRWSDAKDDLRTFQIK